ncbi:heavy metal-associated isoprenylated plant protein 47-like [Cynara cardunculus var. scolymus]|uniref:heavy metal-associated isoprenylated plant protein 47-like n=1 Tax=Cynara cardunculus var. scolymus TaxID=59895 RepID=UPI000D62FB51|nr:heavy metal-associated isoprenylated plant protein 47-like [Cynara cardunculus var. scolymus]XP_024967801.1 heavy metal-associated isoprenylated plant protein 47-like [Cynara cardunculus var. scolymus]XP_024967802.1 heavy metal-associated isoprenylated plant protein 47-like [Cynara cardunculus var. scolymus]
MGSIKSFPFPFSLSKPPLPDPLNLPGNPNTYIQIIKFTEMAKQKIVVKVTMTSDKKTRKALKIAVSLCGVESASIVGSDKDQIAVTGEGIDSVELTTLLRKGVGYTELVSVGPVEEKKESKATVEIHPYQYYYDYYVPSYYVYGM